MTDQRLPLQLSHALRKSLIATSDGNVHRLYGSGGNILKCSKPGIASGTLWKLAGYNWIEDEPGTSTGTIIRKVRMRLTKAGTNVLGRASLPR